MSLSKLWIGDAALELLARDILIHVEISVEATRSHCLLPWHDLVVVKELLLGFPIPLADL